MPRTEFSQSLLPITIRLFLVGAVMLVLLSIYPLSCGSGYRVGTGAIVYNDDADAFIDRKEYIHVVDHSLEAGRGIVGREMHEGNQRVGVNLLIADTWEAVYEYDIPDNGRKKQWVQPAAEAVCPEGECASIEHGGFVTNATGALVLCEAHAQRLLARKLKTAEWGERDAYEDADTYRIHLGGSPLDATAIAHGVVVVALSAKFDDRGSGEQPKPGALVVHESCPPDTPKDRPYERLTRLEINVTHPVGLGFWQVEKPTKDGRKELEDRLYVADATPGLLTWRYFRLEKTIFKELGVVWSTPLPARAPWPRLHHMEVAEAREPGRPGTQAVFAGGPDGLYIFRGQGGLLAKYHLDAPVSGLAFVSDHELLMTVGRRVARLKTKGLKRQSPFTLPVEQVKACGATGPSTSR